jgi:hypothetical protein
MKISSIDEARQFLTDLCNRVATDNVIGIFDEFMVQRYHNSIWLSPDFTGSMFEYTAVIMIEEITEVFVEKNVNNINHLLEELGDLFGVYECIRLEFRASRFPWTPLNTIIDPLMVIKRITKIIRFPNNDLYYVKDALDAVGEYFRTNIGVVSYQYKSLAPYNMVYFIIASSFVKGIRRLFLRFDKRASVEEIKMYQNLMINRYNNNLRVHSKVSKSGLSDLVRFERQLIDG